jgi:hypothetical protein
MMRLFFFMMVQDKIVLILVLCHFGVNGAFKFTKKNLKYQGTAPVKTKK